MNVASRGATSSQETWRRYVLASFVLFVVGVPASFALGRAGLDRVLVPLPEALPALVLYGIALLGVCLLLLSCVGSAPVATTSGVRAHGRRRGRRTVGHQRDGRHLLRHADGPQLFDDGTVAR